MIMHTVRLSSNRIRLIFILFGVVIAIVVVVNKTWWLRDVFKASAVVERVEQHVHVVQAMSVVDPMTMAWRLGNETHCVTRQVGSLPVPICTYSAKDDPIVSNSVQQGGYFEGSWVDEIIKLLRKHSTPISSAIFIDIGANIGSYSLAAVHAGYHVSDNCTLLL